VLHSPPAIKKLGLTDYEPVWQSMKLFTEQRSDTTIDEFWVTEHYPVYTQGLNGRREHIINPGEIPVVQVDRGGQVTYHGPGQLVIYCLLDLTRLGLGIRQLVTAIEQSIVRLLDIYGIQAHARKDAPGVYVNEAKIAALGLRVRKGRCYHGLSLNLDMDLTPFSGIDPCGYRNLVITQLSDFVNDFSGEQVQQQLCSILIEETGYE
jgi:lipoyl(octanoyl) transferase